MAVTSYVSKHSWVMILFAALTEHFQRDLKETKLKCFLISCETAYTVMLYLTSSPIFFSPIRLRSDFQQKNLCNEGPCPDRGVCFPPNHVSQH